MLFASAGLIASCGGSSDPLSREQESMPEPAAYASESDTEEKEATVDDLAPDLSDFIPKYMAKLNTFRTYKRVTKGETKSKLAFIDLPTQSIDVTFLKNEYSYLKNESHGAVDTVHEAYFHEENTLVKNLGDAEYKPVAMNDYLNAYGVRPDGYNIEGYSLGEGAVTSIVKGTETNSFVIAFDKDKATNNVRIQMKAFGGLDDYPSFQSVQVTVYVENDFTPIKYKVSADYKAKKFVETDCHQEYEVAFSSLNEVVEIPDLAAIREKYKF